MRSVFWEKRRRLTSMGAAAHGARKSLTGAATPPTHQGCQIVSCLSPFYHLPAARVSGVVLICINMQEFIDCLPWQFCGEGKRVLQSPICANYWVLAVLPVSREGQTMLREHCRAQPEEPPCQGVFNQTDVSQAFLTPMSLTCQS